MSETQPDEQDEDLSKRKRIIGKSRPFVLSSSMLGVKRKVNEVTDPNQGAEDNGAKWQCIEGISHEQMQEARETRKEGCTSQTGRIGHPVPDSDSGAMRSPRCLRHTGEGGGSVPGYQVPEHKAESETVLETVKKGTQPHSHRSRTSHKAGSQARSVKIAVETEGKAGSKAAAKTKEEARGRRALLL